jgi:hypothetical protein
MKWHLVKWPLVLFIVAAATGASHPCIAADPRYPDWPCAQAKVPGISIAAVWSGPAIDDVTDKWKQDGKVSALVTRLAARRVPIDEAQKTITEFLAGSASDKSEKGKLLFAGLFDTFNAQRASVMNGLEHVTHKQRDAAERIRSDTLELQGLQDASTPDQPKIEQLGSQVLWETRIFEDRNRVIKFACEVPTAIDQRLFALARAIQQEIE